MTAVTIYYSNNKIQTHKHIKSFLSFLHFLILYLPSFLLFCSLLYMGFLPSFHYRLPFTLSPFFPCSSFSHFTVSSYPHSLPHVHNSFCCLDVQTTEPQEVLLQIVYSLFLEFTPFQVNLAVHKDCISDGLLTVQPPHLAGENLKKNFSFGQISLLLYFLSE